MLYEIIKQIYPLINESDFLLQDDGEGPYIREWNYAQPKPTQKQINEALPKVQLQLLTAQFESSIQGYLDSKAQEKGYDNINTACTYAGAPNPFQDESKGFITWRGNVWAYCYAELEKVKAGTRPMPTIEQIISELPIN